MNFARNAAGLLLTSAVSIPLAVLNSIVLARWLTLDDRGIYALAMQVSGLTVVVAQMGWAPASVYRIRRVGSAPAEVLTAGVVAALAITGVLVAATALFFDPFSRYVMPGVPLAVVAVTLGLVPAQLVGRIVNAVARAIDRFDIPNWGLLANQLGGTVLVFVVLVVFDGGVVEALVSLLAWSLVILVWRGGTVVRITGVSRRVKGDELRDGFRFGLKSWMQSLAGQVHERIDILMLAWMLGDQGKPQIAIYVIGVSLAQFLKLVPEAISSALFPKLAGIGDVEAGYYSAMVSRHVTLWVVLSTVGLAAVGPFALPLIYGEQYAASVAPFLVLLPGVGALTLYRVLSRYFVARDRQGVIIVIQGVSVVLNIGLNVQLIPTLGIVGCALASLASYLLEALAITYVFKKSTGVTLAEMFIVRRAELRHHQAAISERVRARLGKRGGS